MSRHAGSGDASLTAATQAWFLTPHLATPLEMELLTRVRGLMHTSMQLLFTLFYLLVTLGISGSSSSPQRLWCHVLGEYPGVQAATEACNFKLSAATCLACNRAMRAMQEQQTFGDALRAAGLQ